MNPRQLRPTPPDSSAGRRPTNLRRSLTTWFILVALLSVSLLGALIYWQARLLLNRSVESQLVSHQASVTRGIRDGLARLENSVAVIGRNPDIAAAIADFSAAFDELSANEELLTGPELEALEEFYRRGLVTALTDAGLEPPALETLLPRTGVGRYLQYHYIARNPFPGEDRFQMSESETDDSRYGVVHAEVHDSLTDQASRLGFGDLLLVDDQGRVLYTTRKRLDLGTDVVSGPHRESGLAKTIMERLPTVAIGETAYADFERYYPAEARPTMFAATAVRADARTIGAVVVEVPVDALNALTTGNGSWLENGLGETGEVYAVGSDRFMRSDSRLWLENPEHYLEQVRDLGTGDVSESVSLFGTTALIQPVSTEAVDSAFAGRSFVGKSMDYLGRQTVAVATPVGSGQLEWVVVASVTSDEASESLRTYVRRILIIAGILIPLVAAAAVVLARSLARPVRPVVATAERVAAGDLEAVAPDCGKNELGDVARRINTLTDDLRSRDRELAEEEQRITGLLLSALPARVADQVREGQRQVSELVTIASIVALNVTGLFDNTSMDVDSAVDLSVRLSAVLESTAEQLGLERVRSSSTQHVFAAGLGSVDGGVDEAAEFSVRAAAEVEGLSSQTGVELGYRVGLCSGDVTAAMLASDQLAYGVFGQAAREALALSSIATTGQILVCEATAASLDDGWTVSTLDGAVDLRGEPLAAKVLEGPRPAPAELGSS